MLEHILFNMLL